MEQREKTLDEKIDDFMLRTKAIPAPEDILKKDDREILAVMNETIHQNIQYLRNLEDQLSTVENKQMILQLVDERAKLMEDLKEQGNTIDDLMADMKSLKAEKQEKEEAIDPGRVRFMQQRILATLDNHVELPNHAMALGKHEFRKNLTKEINDLVRYVLGLDK
jgi:predicted nuclease with TOPRIM domain